MKSFQIKREDCSFIVSDVDHGLSITGPVPSTNFAKQIIADAYHYIWYVENIGNQRNIFWFGRRLIKNPLDLWIYQELIYKTKPSIIIETGTYEGGSALYFAHLLDILGGGKVITIDIEKRDYLPIHQKIEYLIGSSVDPKIIKEIEKKISEYDSVMVILDSNHHPDHVFKELKLYSKFVTKGQYLIVEDTNLGGNPITPNNNSNPIMAVHRFLAQNDEFTIDTQWERFRVTSCPGGFLKRIK